MQQGALWLYLHGTQRHLRKWKQLFSSHCRYGFEYQKVGYTNPSRPILTPSSPPSLFPYPLPIPPLPPALSPNAPFDLPRGRHTQITGYKTTLSNLELAPQCRPNNPCEAVLEFGKHRTVLGGGAERAAACGYYDSACVVTAVCRTRMMLVATSIHCLHVHNRNAPTKNTWVCRGCRTSKIDC